MSLRPVLFIMVLFFIGWHGATAQTNAAAKDLPERTLRISSSLVLVNVVALRSTTASPDRTLDLGDFELLVDNQPVPIRTFDKGNGTSPLAMWFLVQCAMPGWDDKGSGTFRGQIDTFEPVLEKSSGRNIFGVAHWCDDGTSELDLAPTHDARAALDQLTKVMNAPAAPASNNRAGELALQATLLSIIHATRSQVPERVPAVVFLYDDYSAMPKAEADRFVDALLESHLTVYGLRNAQSPKIRMMSWLGGDQGAIAAYLAAQTCGSYLSVSPAQYASGLELILDDLYSRYELGFTAKLLDGKRHKLRVALSDQGRKKHPSIMLRYRSGYVAASSQP